MEIFLPAPKALLFPAIFLIFGLSCSPASAYSPFIRGGLAVKTQAVRSLIPVADTANFQIDPIVGRSGEAIPVSMTLPADIGEAYEHGEGPVFIIFRDVPSGISFSAGFRLTDSWAISIKDVDQLRLQSKSTYAASFIFRAILHRGKHRQPLIREARVLISRDGTDQEKQNIVGATVEPASPNLSNYLPLSPQETAKEFSRAETYIRAGDLQSARLIYAELADQGNARAALLMAQSYDPEILREAFIVGLRPDMEKALEWYHKAAELGETAATQRLQILAGQ